MFTLKSKIETTQGAIARQQDELATTERKIAALSKCLYRDECVGYHTHENSEREWRDWHMTGRELLRELESQQLDKIVQLQEKLSRLNGKVK